MLLGGAGTLLHDASGNQADRPGEARRLARLSEAALARGSIPTGAELRGALREPAP